MLINRWVIKYALLLDRRARQIKKPVASSWRMDETYIINVKGKWKYYYRAVDKYGNVIDFLLCEHRDEKAAHDFFNKAIDHNGLPEKVVIDKSGAKATLAGIELWSMIKNGQLDNPDGLSVWNEFYALAA